MNKHGKHDLDIPVIVNPRNDPPLINVPEFIMLENVTKDDIHFPGHIHFPGILQFTRNNNVLLCICLL